MLVIVLIVSILSIMPLLSSPNSQQGSVLRLTFTVELGVKGSMQPLQEDIFLALQSARLLAVYSVFVLVHISSVLFCVWTVISICRSTGPCVIHWLYDFIHYACVCVRETTCVMYCVLSCHSRSIGIQCGSLSSCCSHLCSLGDTV